MRLLIIVDVFLPFNTSAALQIRDLARALSCQGHNCVVITPDSTLNQGFRLEQHVDYRVLRIRSAPLKNVRWMRRAINEILLSWHMWRKYKTSPIRQEPVDGIIFYSPSIFFGAFVSMLKRIHGCHAYLILRDIFPEWPVQLGLMRRGLVYCFFKQFELYQYRVADVIGVESPSNLTYFQGTHEDVEVLNNWIELKNTPISCSKQDSGIVTIVYAGTMGVAQDMDNVLRLAQRLRARTDIRFLLIGSGSEKHRIKDLVAHEQIVSVVIRDEIDAGDLHSLLRNCDIGLITLNKRLLTHNIPGKLMTYLEAGLPVLASINPGNDLKHLVENAGAGIVVWNGDDAAFEASARLMASDKALRRRMQIQARLLCEERFSAEGVAYQLSARLKRT